MRKRTNQVTDLSTTGGNRESQRRNKVLGVWEKERTRFEKLSKFKVTMGGTSTIIGAGCTVLKAKRVMG